MRILILFLLLAAVASPAVSADRLRGPIRAEVLRVVDGDTVLVRALIWPGQRVEVKVRLAGINAPEKYRPKCLQEKELAQQATDYVLQKIGKEIDLQDIRFGKYAGRVVADIRTQSGQDLAKLLVDAGLAHQQKARMSWCSTNN